jgi:hypothetical protein
VNATRFLAVALLVAGVLALVYERVTFTRERHEAKIGPLELSIDEKESVAIPTWAGVAAIAAGGTLLLMAGRKR